MQEAVKPKRTKRRLVKWGIVLILVIVGIFIVFKVINTPAKGEIKVVKSDEAEVITKVENKKLQGKYVDFEYPGNYQLQTNDSPSASLEHWLFVNHKAQGLALGEVSKISVVVDRLKEGGVKEDSAYNNFEANPQFYSLSEGEYGGESVIIAKRTDPSFEKTILWEHDGYLLSVSLTTGGEDAELTSQLETILTSLSWHI